MREYVLTGTLALICLMNATRPLVHLPVVNKVPAQTSVDWPMQFMGHGLVPIPLTPEETAFYEDFPGEAAQFLSGKERLILRRVDRATRKLHAARDCFRGMGFILEEEGLKRDPYERVWRSFKAVKHNQRLLVFEQIADPDGNSWSDVSAWYWAVVSGRTVGPWLSYVRIQDLESEVEG